MLTRSLSSFIRNDLQTFRLDVKTISWQKFRGGSSAIIVRRCSAQHPWNSKCHQEASIISPAYCYWGNAAGEPNVPNHR